MPRCSTPCATDTATRLAVLGGIAVRGADACGPDGATVVDTLARTRADLVADGIHSTLRHALLGDDAPHYSGGDDAYRALIDVDAIDPHSPVFEIVRAAGDDLAHWPARDPLLGARAPAAEPRRDRAGRRQHARIVEQQGDRATLEAADGWDPRLVG